MGTAYEYHGVEDLLGQDAVPRDGAARIELVSRICMLQGLDLC